MFAGAAREAVFSNPEVIRRVNAEFIPVALKAGLVNNPPAGAEGLLYREIGRSKPAPQGICVANSAGKVLDWALMFDDDKSVMKFLEHCRKRYARFPDAKQPVPAERFMKFPSRKLADVRDTTGPLQIPARHADKARCPAMPAVEAGTLVGRVIGRALGKDGKPVADTLKQEHYMEARFEISVSVQETLIKELKRAKTKGDKISVPNELARALVGPAYLGQLDVSPLGGRSVGGRTDRSKWNFQAKRIEAGGAIVRVRITGASDVAGGQAVQFLKSDGRRWEHEVKLDWEGYIDVDLKTQRFTRMVFVARGNEKLRWGNKFWKPDKQSAVSHLPAGHPIDLQCGVRYGLVAKPATEDEVVDPGADGASNQPQPQRRPNWKRSAIRQQLAGMLGPRFLVLRSNIWKELKLSNQQRRKLAAIRESEVDTFIELMKSLQGKQPRQRSRQILQYRRGAIERLDEGLQEIVTKKQQSRLKQLELQQQGLFALNNVEIQRQLSLTDKQREKFSGVVQETQQRIKSLQQKERNRNNERRVKRQIMKIRKQQESKIAALLTESQKAVWRKLIGAPVADTPKDK